MHRVVFVLVPAETNNFEEKVEDLLTGSGNEVFPEYQSRCYCIGSTAKVQSYDSFDSSERGRELGKLLENARINSDEVEEEKILRERYDTVTKLTKKHPLYNKADTDCNACNGKGHYTERRDPKGCWDWWVIGGRWNGIFSDTPALHTLSDEGLNGNVADAARLDLDSPPSVVVTEEGHWYEGPFLVAGAFERELEEHEIEEKKLWQQAFADLIKKHGNGLVVAVDCHS